MKPGNRRQRLFSVEGDNSFIVVVCLAATTVSPFMSIQMCCALIVFTAFILYSLQFSHKTLPVIFVFQCAGFMMTLKSLPSTYNKDLQVWKSVFTWFHLEGSQISPNIQLSLSPCSPFRRIRRPCLTAMITFRLCCRWPPESCQLWRSDNQFTAVSFEK